MKNVIVLGASDDRSRFANKAVRAYLEAGYRVFAVHPTATECEGSPVYRAIADVPEPSELLLLYVRPNVSIGVIDQAPKAGVRRVFLNPGTESDALRERIRALGMEPIEDCAIVAIGRSPAEFPAW